MVLTRGLKITAAGLAAGIAAAAILVRGMSSLLFGVRPLDAVAFLGSAAVLTAVALLAAAVPAWKAARVDPAIALRQD
jgi:ABC-type antimicrobial peptide transport system permease subunit